MSTYKAEVVKVELKHHPKADNLSIVDVFDYCVCVRTELWKNHRLGVYIPPDTLVDVSRPEFLFLAKESKNGWYLVQSKRLRGTPSYGLLIPAPVNAKLGDDLFTELGCQHYQPYNIDSYGEMGKSPSGMIPKYDILSLQQHANLFKSEETVWIDEKFDGAGARYAYQKEIFFAGSRTEWKKEAYSIICWQCFYNQPEIAEWCKANEGYVLYGEIIGLVSDMNYGLTQPKFFAFDIYETKNGIWSNRKDFYASCKKFNVPTTLNLGTMKFDIKVIVNMANGKSTFPGSNHVREGIIVRPEIERRDDVLGRVILKMAGVDYYDRKRNKEFSKKTSPLGDLVTELFSVNS